MEDILRKNASPASLSPPTPSRKNFLSIQTRHEGCRHEASLIPQRMCLCRATEKYISGAISIHIYVAFSRCHHICACRSPPRRGPAHLHQPSARCPSNRVEIACIVAVDKTSSTNLPVATTCLP
eukprot:scaffold173755_cov16-Prasinocladus_malaysianus.AAC.1